MKSIYNNHKNFLLKLFIGALLQGCFLDLFAQNQTVVKATKTDKTYANTTEIHKSEASSDTQVLNEVANNYGMGDVVRITVAPPPPPPTKPVEKSVKMAIQVNEKSVLPTIITGKNLPVNDAGISVEKSVTTVENKEIITNKRVNTEGVVAKKISSNAKSPKGYYSYSGTSNSKRFLFFKKKKTNATMKVGRNDTAKYGCYKF